MKTFSKRNNKKLVAGLVTVLSAVAVVSTGFASWVISAGDTETATGSITVDTVDNSNVHTMTTPQWDGTGGTVYFGAPTADEKEDFDTPWLTNGGAASVLTVTATFDVTNGSDNSVFETITLEETEGTKYSTAGELVGALPTWSSTNTASTAAPCIYTVNSGTTYTVGIKFAWGSHFNGKNPYNFYNAHKATDILDGDTTYAADADASLTALYALNTATYKLTIVTK